MDSHCNESDLRVAPRSATVATVLLFAVTIFASAFLLFWIQLFFGKLLLPELGGSPSVWTTCLVFFQSILTIGYLYAHWSSRFPIKQQVLTQISLMVCALPFLPIGVAQIEGFPTPNQPLLSTLVLLATSVGVPFLAIAGLSPLLQSWFLRVTAAPNIYAFYAASNLGSLGSLIAYPLLIETKVGMRLQGILWALSYLVVVALVMSCGYFAWRGQVQSKRVSKPQTQLAWKTKFSWLYWAFLASSLLSGVTVFTTVHVAPFPLLWAIFLGLYLLTFILVFAPVPQLIPNEFINAFPVLLGLYFLFREMGLEKLVLSFTFVIFLLVAWGCHTRVVEQKPESEHLTQFYLWLSIGGALGGFFNAIVAPLIFNSYFEYELILLVSALSLLITGIKIRGRRIEIGLALVLLTVSLLGLSGSPNSVYSERSFFGAYRVVNEDDRHLLVHGNTLHGLQFLDEERRNQPVSYYARSGPVGDVFSSVEGRSNLRVAVVGLGVGILASYSKPGQAWDYYEIDPLMADLAQERFTYLSQSRAESHFYVGDARLKIAELPGSKQYDLLVVDAFISDSIPQHLITQEAISLYLQHLKPDGKIVYHVSNRYINLNLVLGRIAEQLNLVSLYRKDASTPEEVKQIGKAPSKWVVLSRLPQENLGPDWLPLESGGLLWTDDFAPIYPLLHSSKD